MSAWTHVCHGATEKPLRMVIHAGPCLYCGAGAHRKPAPTCTRCGDRGCDWCRGGDL